MNRLLSIPVLLLGLLACAGYGDVLLRLLRHRRRSEPLGSVYALALGMGVVAYLVLALGLIGQLHPAALAAVAAAGWVLAVPLSRGILKRRSSGEPPPDKSQETPVERWSTLLVCGFLGLAGLVTLAGALRLPDGLDWDGLSYHLATPKIYLRDARISLIAYDSHSDFPATMEMLYALGMAFAGAPGAKLFHWAAGCLTATGIGLWTESLNVNGRRLPRWAAPLAAALFLSMPIVLWEMGTAYIELGTTLFQFLALVALVDAVRREEDGWRLDLPGVVLAGVFSGFALGTKYTALIHCGLLGLGLLWLLFRGGKAVRKAAGAAIGAFAGAALLVALPWYLKNWLWVHNPVYPFLYGLFPKSFSWNKVAADAYAGEQFTFGTGPHPAAVLNAIRELAFPHPQPGQPPPHPTPAEWRAALLQVPAMFGRFLTAPWDLAVHGRAFYIVQRTLLGDRLGSMGPVWAGLLPLLMWVRGLGWQMRALLAYVLGSFVIWFFALSQQARYLLPVCAPLAVVLVMVVVLLDSRILRVAAAVFLGAALACNLGIYLPLAAGSLQILADSPDVEGQYVDSSLQGVYSASQFINRLPGNVRVATYQESRCYYIDRPYFWANPLQHDLIPYDRIHTGDELAAELRRFGITHVLVNFQFFRGQETTSWGRPLADAINRGRFVPVFHAGPEQAPVGVFEIR